MFFRFRAASYLAPLFLCEVESSEKALRISSSPFVPVFSLFFCEFNARVIGAVRFLVLSLSVCCVIAGSMFRRVMARGSAAANETPSPPSPAPLRVWSPPHLHTARPDLLTESGASPLDYYNIVPWKLTFVACLDAHPRRLNAVVFPLSTTLRLR